MSCIHISLFINGIQQLFTDAKGYLITEMVWEEVTDDEADDPLMVASSYRPNKAKTPLKDLTNMDDDVIANNSDSMNEAGGKAPKTNDNVKEKKTAGATAASKGKKALSSSSVTAISVTTTGKQQQKMLSFFTKKM